MLCFAFLSNTGDRKEELGRLAATKIRNMIEGKKESSEYLDWLE